MNTLASAPRAIDHLVLPTRDLAVARARLTALGFTVAPEGIHPFGTRNTCVYFADGTFLEPLAQGDEAAVRQAVAEGNVFVARDQAFRRRNGEEGFSAIVLATDDAEADHARFVAAGVSAGDTLAFSRPFADASGKQDTASFKLAFAADANAPDLFAFTCQRVNAPKVDRGGLQAHANGVLRIVSVVASAAMPAKFNDLLATIFGTTADRDSGSFRLPNATVAIVDPDQFAKQFGEAAASPDGLRLSPIVFGVGDLAATETLFRSRAVQYQRRGDRLVVPMLPGQGAIFAFEEFS